VVLSVRFKADERTARTQAEVLERGRKPANGKGAVAGTPTKKLNFYLIKTQSMTTACSVGLERERRLLFPLLTHDAPLETSASHHILTWGIGCRMSYCACRTVQNWVTWHAHPKRRFSWWLRILDWSSAHSPRCSAHPRLPVAEATAKNVVSDATFAQNETLPSSSHRDCGRASKARSTSVTVGCRVLPPTVRVPITATLRVGT
jgi:hypothetical protein